MNYLNITKYIYLVIGIIMLVLGITKINSPESPGIYFILAAAAFFLVYFRHKFAKKFQDRNNQSK